MDIAEVFIYGRKHPSVSGKQRPSVRTSMTSLRREDGSFCKVNISYYLKYANLELNYLLLSTSAWEVCNVRIIKKLIYFIDSKPIYLHQLQGVFCNILTRSARKITNLINNIFLIFLY